MKSFFSPAPWGSLNITRQIEHIACCFLVPLLVAIFGNASVAPVSCDTYYIGVDIDNLAAVPVATFTSLTHGSTAAAALRNTTDTQIDPADGAYRRWQSACRLCKTDLVQAKIERSDFNIVA